MNYQTDNNYKKYVNFEEEGILLSMAKVKNYADFEKKKEKTGGVNFNWFIPIEKLSELSINEKSGYTNIVYISNKGNEKKLKFTFQDKSEGLHATNGMASLYGLQRAEKKENKAIAFLLSVFPLALTLLFTWLIYGMAHEIETLGSFQSQENTSNNEKLLALIAEKLGTMGTLSIGGVAAVFFGYRTVMRFMKPATINIWKPSKEI